MPVIIEILCRAEPALPRSQFRGARGDGLHGLLFRLFSDFP
jgi:hypothetical protein